jgi:hypothetical protein
LQAFVLAGLAGRKKFARICGVSKLFGEFQIRAGVTFPPKRGMPMRISYRTTDEVNLDLAMRLAENCAMTLDVLWPKDPAPDGLFDVVLYDLDCLSPREREEVWEALLDRPVQSPVAVHGHCLEERQMLFLRQQGVVAAQNLGQEIFAGMRLMVGRMGNGTPPPGEQFPQVISTGNRCHCTRPSLGEIGTEKGEIHHSVDWKKV